MEYRELGRTNLEVSVIGLGTEYLYEATRETVNSVVRAAIEAGVNYIDLVFSFKEYLNNFAFALRDQRDKAILTGHLGSGVKNGQYYKTRNWGECEKYFLEFLLYSQMDYVDILFLHNFNTLRDYEDVMSVNGIFELAKSLRKEGKTRFVGISLHSYELGIEVAKSGRIDVIMAPLNLSGNAIPLKEEFLGECVRNDIGIVAMKPYAGGRLIEGRKTVNIAKYRSGGLSIKLEKNIAITPVQCISYSLSHVGVSTVVPGVKNNKELSDSLEYLEATDEEKDFSGVIKDFGQYSKGECVYCNHCLPCPSSIDIGRVARLVDSTQYRSIKELKDDYNTISVKASTCNECGVCVERCPFNVDVISKIKKAVRLFE